MLCVESFVVGISLSVAVTFAVCAGLTDILADNSVAEIVVNALSAVVAAVLSSRRSWCSLTEKRKCCRCHRRHRNRHSHRLCLSGIPATGGETLSPEPHFPGSP